MSNVKQAPSMFTADADLQQQQAELMRRQQLADMLRKSAMTPIETGQMVTGAGPARAVPISPWQGLFKLGEAVLARHNQSKNDDEGKGIASAIQQKRIAALRSLAPEGTFDEAPQQPAGKAEAMALGANSQTQGTQVDPGVKSAWVRALKLMDTNPALGEKLVENLSTLTTNQKDWNAQGLNPRDVGSAEMNKLRAAALLNVAPNSTVLDAATNKPVYAGSDFSKGVQNSFGPNGAPQIQQMQGAELIPKMAGDIKRAEAAGGAAYNMVTVNTPEGPRLMTAEQAAQMSGGQQPQAPQPMQQQPRQQGNLGFPPGANIPANTHGLQSRQEILNQELQKTLALPDTDQRKAGDIAALQREIAGSRNSQPMQGVQGIPLQSDAEKARNVGQVGVDLAVQEKQRKDAMEAGIKSEKMFVQIQSAIPMAREYLKTATGSGLGALADSAMGFVGKTSQGGQSAAQLDTLAGWMTSNVPRMEGPQSNADSALYQKMAANIGDRTRPVEERMQALGTLEALQNKYRSLNGGGQAAPMQQAQIKQQSTQQPAQKLRRYNPQTGRIE